MNWMQNLIVKLLKITPATEKEITIKQAYTFQQNIQKNRIWYHGEPSELEQFFKKTCSSESDRTRFWAATPNSKIRKIHSGIVGMVVDRYSDIVTTDFDGITIGEGAESSEIQEQWEKIAEDNSFEDILGEAVQGALAVGDGAFKISTDEVSQYPIIEFYDADNVSFVYRYKRLEEIKFYTDYPQKNGKVFRLEETYGKGSIKYKLFDDRGREQKRDILEETKDLEDTAFDGDFIMAVPFRIFSSNKWKGRGKALFDAKSDVLDALDETISQWLDAIRLGRIKRYIPDDLIPKDPATGTPLQPNPFDNDFLAVGSSMDENGTQKIDISQPQINYEAYVSSYLNFLDMALQGAMSPATLGIDLKKTDNASAQREKEKITLHVRGKIIDALNKALPPLVLAVLKTDALLREEILEDCDITVKFGEYAGPDFNSRVETVSKAKGSSIMSIERAIDELYGDSMSDDKKEEEIARLKAEQGIAEMEEPEVGADGLDIVDDEAGVSTLNGAQISSLMNVIAMVKSGSVTRTEAIAIITSTLGISRDTAEQFIEERI